MPSPSRSILMMPRSAQSSLSHCTMRRPSMRGGLDRDDLVEASGGDHDAAAMLSEMTREALDGADQLDPVTHLRRVGIEPGPPGVGPRARVRPPSVSLRLARCPLARGRGRGRGHWSAARPRAAPGLGRKIESRDALREASDRLGIHSEHLAHLAHGHLDPVGDHVRGHRGAHPAVFVEDVLDDLLALVAGGKVDVDIRPLAAFLGEESFEEEIPCARGRRP